MTTSVKLLIIFVLGVLSVGFISCINTTDRYYYGKDKCRNVCKSKQENNIGASFMPGDIEITFGRCSCVSSDGQKREFFIKVVDK